MITYEVGCLVKSLAGHSKGNLFIILREDQEYVYLVDGIIRTIDNPKRKNKKHIQIIHEYNRELGQRLMNGERVMNEELKRIINCYKKRSKVI